MADKRMISKKIVDTDFFLALSATAQNLYFHLLLRADDDGFISNPKAIMKTIGSSEEDILSLIRNKFVISFDNGVVVIKHWWIHNYIKKDRYKETTWKDEKYMLAIDENGSYTTSEILPEAKFKKPTLDEVKQYCIDRKNAVDPSRFVNYYESKGWKVGKAPMKDWKACIRNWENTSFTNNKSVIPDYSENESKFDENEFKRIMSERNQ